MERVRPKARSERKKVRGRVVGIDGAENMSKEQTIKILESLLF